METKVSDELLKHLEGLAKFELLEDERIELKKDIEEILQYMTLLDGVDPDAEEMVTPVEKSLEPGKTSWLSSRNRDSFEISFPIQRGAI